ncbi:MAG: dual-specificity RNA methyltransferase RlmN [Planctomycetota bacterium]|jgi:23S rRNA (adenine2503-C2)-methyltransferase
MPSSSDTPVCLSGLTLDAMEALLVSWGEPRYRAKQVFHAVQRESQLDPVAMTVLPRPLRERLARETVPSATREIEVQASEDGTRKFLLALADERRIETVLIPEGRRRTVCVSTQVGCPIGCVFCASGVGGLVRDLTTAEIAEQVLRVQASLGHRPSHVVVMGMGDGLLNLGPLAAAIRLWCHPEGMGFSPRRITVSTAARGALVDRLADEELGVGLAVSLHGPDDETRQRLVPTSRPGRVRELVEAATRYARRTGRDVTVEYVLIAGENDRTHHASALAGLLAGRHIHVNLLPLNPVAHRPDLRAPSGREALAFAARLREAGVATTLRSRRGEDIHAACGQLALERSLPGGGGG